MGRFGHFHFHHYYGVDTHSFQMGTKNRRIFKKSLRLTPSCYSIFVFIVKGERQHFKLLPFTIMLHLLA